MLASLTPLFPPLIDQSLALGHPVKYPAHPKYCPCPPASVSSSVPCPTSFHQVNLGNPEEYSIADFAQIVIDLVGSEKSKVIHDPMPQDDPRRRKPDIQRAKKHLDWQPKISMRDGLKKTIAFFRGELNRTTLKTYQKPQLGTS